ncbi:MAG: type I restriction enzyme HsdR N-terminal domain-containing protein [bacterium]|nr:type I restriction enzyme HsdR N-terminal domain-containing protein [bacterium]
MIGLNLPSFPAKVIVKGDKRQIFDAIRRKYVVLTPEEWVRQHFVHYLMAEKGYPQELMGNEVPIQLNGTSKRCDTVVFNRFLEPLMIVEYKAPTVGISSAVFAQIARYNMVLHVRYLIVSNGLRHFCCRVDYEAGSYTFLPTIPAYEELLSERVQPTT